MWVGVGVCVCVCVCVGGGGGAGGGQIVRFSFLLIPQISLCGKGCSFNEAQVKADGAIFRERASSLIPYWFRCSVLQTTAENNEATKLINSLFHEDLLHQAQSCFREEEKRDRIWS